MAWIDKLVGRSPIGSIQKHMSVAVLCVREVVPLVEAMAAGDKTTCENFLQHADHFTRIIGDKNKNKDQNRSNIVNKSIAEDKQASQNNNIGQEEVTKNKE